MPTMNKMQLWLRDYERSRHSKQPNESWQSSKFDFTDPYVRLEYVPEMGCSVGGCISALRKSWTAYRIAGRNGEPRGDLAWRINRLQDSLGLERSIFSELEGMDDDEEEEASGDGGEWESNLNYGTNEPYTEEWSEEDKQLIREEREAEKKNDDWWFN